MNTVEEIVEVAKKLIEFESVEAKPAELKKAIDFAEAYLSKNTPLHLSRFAVEGKHNLVATFKKTKTPAVFFHCHLDVVPGRPEQFLPRQEGERLYGRGASDTKGNGAALLVLAKELSSQIPDPALRAHSGSGIYQLQTPDVGFMFTTDEEVGGHRGAKYLLEKGFRPRFFLTAEPTSFNIVPYHKGVLWLKIKVRGKSAHGSRPWDGENAALKAYQSLELFYEFYPLPKKPKWQTTVNLGGISGGDAFNKVMAECELRLDVRYVEKDQPAEIVRRARKCFPDSAIEIVEEEPGMTTAFDDPYVVKLSRVVRAVTGSNPEIRRGHGACDGRFFCAAGIPAVQFGTPSQGLHTDEEWLKIAPLKNFFQILWEFSNSF